MTAKAKIGDTIRILEMKGEPQYAGKIGVVEFTNENGEGGGIYGPIVKGARVFVHYSQIIEVRTGFRCDGEEN